MPEKATEDDGAVARSMAQMHPERLENAETSFGDPASEALIRGIEAFLGERVASMAGVTVQHLSVADQGVSATCWIAEASWTAPDGMPHARRFVFRLQTQGQAFDNSREAEFRILQAVTHRTTVRAPRALWYCKDSDFLNTPFAVYEWVDGAAHYDLFSDRQRSRQERRHLFDQFLDLLLHIHAVDWAALKLEEHNTLTGSRQPGDAGHPCQSQLEHNLRRLGMLEGTYECSEVTREAVAWLGEHVPAVSRLTLVHGDFGPHNILVRDGVVVALVDWEFACVSDPAQDLAYFTLRGRSIRDNFDQDILAPEAFVEDYARRVGRDVDPGALRWWQVLAMVRAVIARAHQARWRQRLQSAGGRQLPILPSAEDDRVLARLLS